MVLIFGIVGIGVAIFIMVTTYIVCNIVTNLLTDKIRQKNIYCRQITETSHVFT